MDTTSALMGSPRGRFFCANIGYACSRHERASGYSRPRTVGDVIDALANVDIEAIAALSEMDVLDGFAYAVDFARYWQPPDEDDIMFVLPEVVELLLPIARAVLASPHTQWWAEPVDLVNQRIVQKYDRTDDPGVTPLHIRQFEDGLERWRAHTLDYEATFVEYLKADPDRQIGGEWWSIPAANGAYDTSRARDVLGAIELMLVEDNPGSSIAHVWPVSVHGTPRVYEITSPADWAHLVDTYPLAVPASRRHVWHETTGEYRDWFIPDWSKVVNDYDAVHLSMIGYLTTPGIAIPLARNSGATVLAGWNPDTIFWLNSSFITVDGNMTEWQPNAENLWAPV
ncbi:hypothetical protein ACFRFQ_09050 [Rhodococcus sp. NPDC056743]|uniref:hypothetical protein n=1 Tax=Rhodococcus sp. NPDC056743 TaxID=3345934 RepID=UPI003672C8B8